MGAALGNGRSCGRHGVSEVLKLFETLGTYGDGVGDLANVPNTTKFCALGVWVCEFQHKVKLKRIYL